MTVYQINVFMCNKCGRVKTEEDQTFVSDFGDPVIRPPIGWGFLENKYEHLCDNCLKTEPDDANKHVF